MSQLVDPLGVFVGTYLHNVLFFITLKANPVKKVTNALLDFRIAERKTNELNGFKYWLCH
jgi:hypothetical protein